MSEKKTTLGHVLIGPHDRDAVHVAIAPVVAYETLQPGQHVAVDDKGRAWSGKSGIEKVGVVDPFLKGPVSAGDNFYVLIYPGKVKNLRHHWDHPAFVEPEPEPDYDDSCSGC